ncbi:MAG: gfo/Idh/MocA family oxidoreductase [Betaproteobacteria bacterium]|nr:MAG: gfo/Idh/MocA family oxidoreductase [Betaproteobacteria bacterium]
MPDPSASSFRRKPESSSLDDWRCWVPARAAPQRDFLRGALGRNAGVIELLQRTKAKRNPVAQSRPLGVAVIGAGRIGTLRARLAAKHPSVGFVAIADRDPARAKALAETTNADLHSGNNFEIIERPEVNAVFVSTPEGEHAAPVKRALELGKPVLVEKPIALALGDAADILATLKTTGGDLRVGYSRRYKECYLRAKEQMIQGRLGRVTGGLARVYNSRAQAFAILQRDPHATPVLDVLTYYVDLMCWFLEGNPPVEIVARGQHGIFREAGYGAHDVTWAIVTFADGAVVNFGVSYALPAKYPTMGQSDRVELLGTEGTMIIDDDHMDHVLYSDRGIPHAYVPDHQVNMAFLGSNTAGDWAVGDFWGPLGNETRAWLDHLVTGQPTVHTTPQQALINLQTTLAIERSAVTGQPVRLPLET